MQTTVPRGRTYCCVHVSIGCSDGADASWWSYLCSLLEGLLVHGNEDNGVRTLSVFGRLLHLLDHVLASGEVNECCCAQLLQAHLLLLVARVDSNHVQAHGFGVLLSEGSKTATSTDDGDGLAGFGA
jgi:hypothetical protein